MGRCNYFLNLFRILRGVLYLRGCCEVLDPSDVFDPREVSSSSEDMVSFLLVRLSDGWGGGILGFLGVFCEFWEPEEELWNTASFALVLFLLIISGL